MSETPLDPVALARDLIRFPSVTPDAADALDHTAALLEDLGFSCRRMPFDDPAGAATDNLLAVRGEARPRLVFAGHLDVVPPGAREAWDHDPFGAAETDDAVVGRGAVDMKGAVAAFIAAAARTPVEAGSIALILTGDEEGDAVNGTKKVVETLIAEGWAADHILVGEPTNPGALGEAIKVGRRGSLNAQIIVRGRQGHVAYPHLAANPVPALVEALGRLMGRRLDEGTETFDPSNLEITTVDVGNPATNVIPGEARALFNIRFNTRHTGEALREWVEAECSGVAKRHDVEIDLDIRVPGEPFHCPPGGFGDLVRDVVRARTGRTPEYSTTGGSSDARFLHKLAPTLEFGLVGESMHKANEAVAKRDLIALTDIYADILAAYFAEAPC